MTAANRKQARRETVALTREDVATILIQNMGWEDIDVQSFWLEALRRNKKKPVN